MMPWLIGVGIFALAAFGVIAYIVSVILPHDPLADLPTETVSTEYTPEGFITYRYDGDS